MEIERRFLVPQIPDPLDPSTRTRIRQFYTEIDEVEKRYHRFRQEAYQSHTMYIETRKHGTGVRRTENERHISQYMHDRAKRHMVGSIVEKFRYDIPYLPHIIELDVFQQQLDGLVIAEIEFETIADAEAFVPPDWFGREVTDDRRYFNAHLALEGLPMLHGFISGLARDRRNGFPPGAPHFVLNILMQELLFELGGRDPKRSCVLGIAGGSASGKTSFATERLNQFPDVTTVLPMDDYFRGVRWMAKHPSFTWDDPEAIDFDRFARDLMELRAGRSIRKPIYDFPTGEPVGEETVEPKPLILVDGLYVLRPPVRDLLDVRMFVRASPLTRLLRRLIRDVDRTGQSATAILKQFTEQVLPRHEQFVAATEGDADIVLDNEFDPRVEAERMALARPQLKFRGSIPERELIRLGAERLAHTHQIDWYLPTPDRDLGRTDELLRLRNESGRWTLAYKGPRGNGPGLQRRTLVVPLDDSTVHALQRWFPPGNLQVTKARDLFQFSEGTVALDSVSVVEPNGVVRPVGHFTEVRWNHETLSSEDALRIAEYLRIDPNFRIDQPYALLAVGATV